MKQQYIAFLRGINISGKNKLSMTELKIVMMTAGFTEVKTVLNSGNVIFRSKEGEHAKELQKLIAEHFGLAIPVFVIKKECLAELVAKAPSWWGKGGELYDNLIFVMNGLSTLEASEQLGPLSEGLERAAIESAGIFWSFSLKNHQRCNWWQKSATLPIKDYLTIRTAKTVAKVLKEG